MTFRVPWAPERSASQVFDINRVADTVMPRPARTVRDRIHLTVFDGRP